MILQGAPSGVALDFVDFDSLVLPCCRGAMPILVELQLPKQNCAHCGSSQIKSQQNLVPDLMVLPVLLHFIKLMEAV